MWTVRDVRSSGMILASALLLAACEKGTGQDAAATGTPASAPASAPVAKNAEGGAAMTPVAVHEAATLPAETVPATGPAANTFPMVMTGRVASWNRGGRGEVESMMLAADGGAVQVLLPNELALAIGQAVKVGDTVEVQVTDDLGPGGRGGPDGRGPDGPGRGGPEGRGGPAEEKVDHPVYQLMRLKDASGKEHVAAGGDDPAGRDSVTMEATIQALNYNRRGMADGLQLDNGDIVRMNGEMMALTLTVGTKIKVEGMAMPMLGGGRMIEATSVNGQVLGPGRGGPGAGPPPGGGMGEGGAFEGPDARGGRGPARGPRGNFGGEAGGGAASAPG